MIPCNLNMTFEVFLAIFLFFFYFEKIFDVGREKEEILHPTKKIEKFILLYLYAPQHAHTIGVKKSLGGFNCAFQV